MNDHEKLKQKILSLINSQKLAALSTFDGVQPYASLVAVAVENDLCKIYFATPETTRKYDNLIKNPKVALLVDNGKNHESDIHEALAVTITGVASRLSKDFQEKALQLYIAKHPYLIDFAESPTTALIQVDVACYYLVERFQNVQKLYITT